MYMSKTISQRYEKIEGYDYEFEHELTYDLGGINYFTGDHEPRGYYASVTPVQIGRKADGTIQCRTFAAFSGTKRCVLPCQRQSEARCRQARELARPAYPELLAHVLGKLKAKGLCPSVQEKV
jgi:hypothetical protein